MEEHNEPVKSWTYKAKARDAYRRMLAQHMMLKAVLEKMYKKQQEYKAQTSVWAKVKNWLLRFW